MGVITTGTILSAAALAAGTIGTIAQAQSTSKQANFQSEIARQQADRERQIAAANATDFERRQSRALASRRAALGASGVEGGEGSALMVSEDFAAESALQALRIRAGGETTASRLESQAGLYRAAGRNAITGGAFRSGALLLTGAGSLYDKQYNRQSAEDNPAPW